jgi:hypothetical protein
MKKKNQQKDKIDSHGERKLLLHDKSVVILSSFVKRIL